MSQQSDLEQEFDPRTLGKVDKGGRKLTYVPIHEVIARINTVLDDFSVIDADAWRDATDPDWVIGKAKVSATIDGHHRTAVGFGGVKVKMLKNGTGPVDLGDEFKGAMSDAIKKACQQFGIALYLSRKEEAIEAELEQTEARAADDAAIAAGWVGAEHRLATVGGLMKRWNVLDAELTAPVKSAMAAQNIQSATMSYQQAEWLDSQLADLEAQR